MYELTHKLAKMSGMAYLPPNIAKHEFNQIGYPHCQFVDNEGAQCYIVWNSKELVLVFRGTEANKWNDIKADINAWFTPQKVGWCHMGFDKELQKLWYQIEWHIEAQAENKKLYITGHSLGGAMATICASKIEFYQVDFLCTFGSPRVGNRKFVKNIPVEHHRYVNNNDIVTSVPPAIMTYKHHGKMKYINHYGKIRYMTVWQRLKDQLRGRWAAFKKKVPFDGAYDHSIKYYIRYTGEKND